MESSLPYWFAITFNIFRYIVIAGTAFLMFYVICPGYFALSKIQSRYAKHKDFIREIMYSLQTIVIFSAYGLLILHTPLKQYTQVYNYLYEYSIWWFPASILVAIVIHDTYFYWMHRAVHHPVLYRKFHIVHHKSINPTPLASYSFNLLEGLAEALIIPILLFTLPMHPYALIIFALFAYTFNVYGHLGYEIAPKWFRKSIFFELMVTSVHHNMHHAKFKRNYGYYFRIWDRLMGTENPDYIKTYDQIQQRRFGTKAISTTSNSTLFALLLPFLWGTTSNKNHEITGIWKDDVGKATISIYKIDDAYFGKLIAAENEKDNQELQVKEILVLSNFKKESENEYCCGTVYQPKQDRLFNGRLVQEDENTLTIKIKYGILKTTRVWHRIE